MASMKEATTSKQYDSWSWVYDRTFGHLLQHRQQRAIQELRPSPGDRVLELGVGTGIMLPHYPRDIQVVGIDLSAGMLDRAQRRIDEQNLHHCHLVLGDAMHLPFAEASFDQVMLSHVVSVVSDPAKLMRWVQRMVKPGGRVVVLNHFRSNVPVLSWIERVGNPLFVKLGWRSDLSLSETLDGVDLQLEYSFKLRMLDLWTIVVLRRPHPGQPRRLPSTCEADDTAGLTIAPEVGT
jgi:phosphatidylethanolamine/phosphatidyl-N-methylethanolamine N-methyltransferase